MSEKFKSRLDAILSTAFSEDSTIASMRSMAWDMHCMPLTRSGNVMLCSHRKFHNGCSKGPVELVASEILEVHGVLQKSWPGRSSGSGGSGGSTVCGLSALLLAAEYLERLEEQQRSA